MASGYLNRRTAPHITTLVIASACGPLALNIFLPSLPGMARYFETDYAVVQLALSLYLTSMAVLQLLVGPASDRFGRRPVLLVSLAIFIVATGGAIFAPTIEVLLACRMCQATASAGMVLSRAVVRDTVEPNLAASRLGYITMGISLAPMLGPLIGGFLDEIYGWKSTFVLTFAFGVLAFAVVWVDLGETNRTPSSSFAAQLRAYPELLRSPRYWAYALTAAFSSGAFFAFLGGAPYVASEILGMSPSAYGVYFGLGAIGYAIGNFISGRYSTAIGINRMMLAGNVITMAGIAVSIVFLALGYDHPVFLFGPVAFTGIGNGITMPSANVGIVSVRPHLAGSASGLGGTLQLGAGALLSVIVGALLSPATGAYPLLVVMFLSALAGLVATLFLIRVARGRGDLP